MFNEHGLEPDLYNELQESVAQFRYGDATAEACKITGHPLQVNLTSMQYAFPFSQDFTGASGLGQCNVIATALGLKLQFGWLPDFNQMLIQSGRSPVKLYMVCGQSPTYFSSPHSNHVWLALYEEDVEAPVLHIDPAFQYIGNGEQYTVTRKESFWKPAVQGQGRYFREHSLHAVRRLLRVSDDRYNIYKYWNIPIIGSLRNSKHIVGIGYGITQIDNPSLDGLVPIVEAYAENGEVAHFTISHENNKPQIQLMYAENTDGAEGFGSAYPEILEILQMMESQARVMHSDGCSHSIGDQSHSIYVINTRWNVEW